jgi:hypothetical protein
MPSEETPGTPGGNTQPETPERREITVRRAPKYVPFLILGGLIGFALAAFLAYGVPGDPSYDRGSVFGFFMVLCGGGGVILGAVAALVLDQVSVRRTRRAVVESAPDNSPDGAGETGTDTGTGTGGQS